MLRHLLRLRRSKLQSGTELYSPLQRAVQRFAAPTLCSLLVGCALYCFSDSLDAAQYAFASPTGSLEMGDVSELLPEHIAHNAQVTLHGITEHRGLRHRGLRGLRGRFETLWYFRLLGSRGIFIEVPADPKKYAPTTEVTVTGRAVDPSREKNYRRLLEAYDDIFHPQRRHAARIIQVDVCRGSGRWPFVFAGALVFAGGLLNLFLFWRGWRS
jgi:hypothetical protein